MTRRLAAVLALGLLSACGGGGSSPTATSTPPATGASKVVVLDSGTFDAQVLAATRPSLVEFRSPT